MNISHSSFNLKSNNADFLQRQRSIFDQLNVLENNRKDVSNNDNRMEIDEQVKSDRKTQRSITKHFRGKESIFKKPQSPAPKNFISQMPDFKKNPHKWTKYTLEDVKEDDISDKGNTRAALSFLKELEDRKSNDMVGDDQKDIPPTKIVFRKPNTSVKLKNCINESPQSSFRSSKVIMPEYIIGQKLKKEKKNKSNGSEKGKELKLDHLLKEED